MYDCCLFKSWAGIKGNAGKADKSAACQTQVRNDNYINLLQELS